MAAPFGFTSLVMASDESFDDGWSRVVPSTLAQANPSRVNEWIAGRIAVSRALSKAGLSVEASTFRSGSHRRLDSSSDWSFSISHTNEWALAWVTNEPSRHSIGVDIEDSDRAISPGVKAKFVFEDDLPLDPIRLWSLKEAAFKAVPDSLQENLVVAKIRIADGTFSIVDRDVRGKWQQELVGDLIRSYAWVERAALPD